jgi:hypothetical protein
MHNQQDQTVILFSNWFSSIEYTRSILVNRLINLFLKADNLSSAALRVYMVGIIILDTYKD